LHDVLGEIHWLHARIETPNGTITKLVDVVEEVKDTTEVESRSKEWASEREQPRNQLRLRGRCQQLHTQMLKPRANGTLAAQRAVLTSTEDHTL
jgi:hypothetical protein